MFSWIKYINTKYAGSQYSQHERDMLENYCNSDDFEYDTKIIAYQEAIDNYYEIIKM